MFPSAADIDVAVGVHIKRSIYGRVWNTDRRLPGDAAIGGPLKLHAAPAAVNAVVCLILKSMSRPVRLVDCEPLLVPSACAALTGEQRP